MTMGGTFWLRAKLRVRGYCGREICREEYAVGRRGNMVR